MNNLLTVQVAHGHKGSTVKLGRGHRSDMADLILAGSNMHTVRRENCMYLDAEELHAHEEADDVIGGGRTLITATQLLQFCHKALPDGREPTTHTTIGVIALHT